MAQMTYPLIKTKIFKPSNCFKFNSGVTVQFMKEQALLKETIWFHVGFNDQWISCICHIWNDNWTMYSWSHNGSPVNEQAIVETIRKWKKYV